MRWSKRERFAAVTGGEPADRPPVTAYRHFPGQENEPVKFANAMVDFQNKYDWDWMKINPSAVYCHEVWGNQYDYDNYNESAVPIRTGYVIHNQEDMEKVVELPGEYGPLGKQLESVRLIRGMVGDDLPIIQTVAAPIAVLLNLCGNRSPGRYREAPREDCALLQHFKENRERTHRALKAIANTLAAYCREVIKAGADGVFYAEFGLAREGYLTYEEWLEFTKPYDLTVLEGARGKTAILHTCGIYGNPGRFTDYPIQALHWAESAPGNPPLKGSEAWLGKIAAMGGIDERLFGMSSAAEIGFRAKKSVAENRRRPFLLAPECTVSVKTLESEYKALREAAEA